MNKVLQFFIDNQEKIFTKEIRAYGWKNEFDTLLISSISKYLFEELDIIENIAPKTNTNRPCEIKPNYYITVHDTGDALKDHTASFWSNVVSIQDWELGRYEASFQYVTGNDGIYHNIPDNEVAYHAGDGTMYDYTLLDSGLTGENEKPSISISEDGYYEIDGVKSKILAPRAKLIENGKVIYDRVAKTSEINTQGILCKLKDGKYYLGETYFNQTYELIANRAGNNNSIGIESCINEGSDIYLTWQRTAKLVAYLLDKENLTFDDVVQHHYFSGKNCPQTIRMSGMWDHFMDLVKFEYQVLLFKKEGYKISFECDNKNVDKNGRLLSYNNEEISYILITQKDNEIEKIEIKL